MDCTSPRFGFATIGRTARPGPLRKYLGVRSIPSLIFFKNGKPVDGLVGAVTKAALAEKLDSLL